MKYSWLSNVKKNEFQSQKIKTWVAYSQAESSEEHGERCIHSTYIYLCLFTKYLLYFKDQNMNKTWHLPLRYSWFIQSDRFVLGMYMKDLKLGKYFSFLWML